MGQVPFGSCSVTVSNEDLILVRPRAHDGRRYFVTRWRHGRRHSYEIRALQDRHANKLRELYVITDKQANLEPAISYDQGVLAWLENTL